MEGEEEEEDGAEEGEEEDGEAGEEEEEDFVEGDARRRWTGEKRRMTRDGEGQVRNVG